jgi:hypothetical protein
VADHTIAQRDAMRAETVERFLCRYVREAPVNDVSRMRPGPSRPTAEAVQHLGGAGVLQRSHFVSSRVLVIRGVELVVRR